MPDHLLPCFHQLKKELISTYRQRDPECAENFSDWSLRCIEGFQEDLQERANGRVSTKWFYTHLKNETTKLPRIDVLNLLSQYVGYAGWEDFVKEKQAAGIGVATPSKPTGKRRKKLKPWLIPLALVPVMIAGIFIVFGWGNEEDVKWQLCLVDASLGTAIEGGAEVVVLQEKESAVILPCPGGCCEIEAGAGMVQLVVRADYYQADTVVRHLTSETPAEEVRLRTDDYALMINIFSRSDVEDYERRRAQLEQMFTDDARIFQIYPGNELGMEMYNKDEFINKLTMPLKSLENIHVLETEYRNGKIYALRFTQK